MTHKRVWVVMGLLSVSLLVNTGCVFERQTTTARTGIEELLLSTAAQRAIRKADFKVLNGKKVFLDLTNLEAVDKGFVIGAIRDRLNVHGGMMVAERKDADAVIEARAAALAIDDDTSFIGVPAIPIPIPAVGTLSTPEIALFKKVDQDSIAKLALFAYDAKTGAHLMSTENKVGKAYYHRWRVLIVIRFQTTDLKERAIFAKDD